MLAVQTEANDVNVSWEVHEHFINPVLVGGTKRALGASIRSFTPPSGGKSSPLCSKGPTLHILLYVVSS